MDELLKCKKFWGWIREKEYRIQDGKLIFKQIDRHNNEFESVLLPPPQMMIGYMDEYLHENGMGVGWPTYGNRKATIDDYYNEKVKMVKTLEDQ